MMWSSHDEIGNDDAGTLLMPLVDGEAGATDMASQVVHSDVGCLRCPDKTKRRMRRRWKVQL